MKTTFIYFEWGSDLWVLLLPFFGTVAGVHQGPETGPLTPAVGTFSPIVNCVGTIETFTSWVDDTPW